MNQRCEGMLLVYSAWIHNPVSFQSTGQLLRSITKVFRVLAAHPIHQLSFCDALFHFAG